MQIEQPGVILSSIKFHRSQRQVWIVCREMSGARPLVGGVGSRANLRQDENNDGIESVRKVS